MPTILSVLFLLALTFLGGCATPDIPPGQVFTATTPKGSVGRQFECQSSNPDGSCNVKQCKQGPGGAEFDCAGYAAACVNAGHHWSGTRELGKCTRVL